MKRENWIRDYICFRLVPPIVSVSSDLIQSEQNENVTIECHVLSRPMARIYWQKTGRLIDENRMTIVRVNQTMSTSRLTIQVGLILISRSIHSISLVLSNRWIQMMTLDNTIVLLKMLMVEWKRLFTFFVRSNRDIFICEWINFHFRWNNDKYKWKDTTILEISFIKNTFKSIIDKYENNYECIYIGLIWYYFVFI